MGKYKYYDQNLISEIVYYIKGQHLDKAYQKVEEYIERYPKDRLGQLYKAEILSLSGQHEEAAELADYIMSLGAFHDVKSKVTAYTVYGNILHAIGRDRESIAAYRTAIDTETFGAPMHPVKAKAGLINVYINQNRLDDALKEIASAMESNIYVFDLQIAVIYSRQGKYLEAIEVLDKLGEKERNSNTANRVYGQCYFNLGEYDKAIKHYKRVVTLKAANYTKILPDLIDCYMRKGEKEVAYQYAKQAYDLGIETDTIVSLMDTNRPTKDVKKELVKHLALFGIPDLGPGHKFKVSFLNNFKSEPIKDDEDTPMDTNEETGPKKVRKPLTPKEKFILKYGYR
jgi:tetratricopeptide (TPR) repeat protein